MLMYMRRDSLYYVLNNVVIMYESEMSNIDEVTLLLKKMYLMIMMLYRKHATLCILYV